MKEIDFPTSEHVLVDSSHADDAGIIRISNEMALVHTIDFFTPVVDDPFLYGQIAVCNALSDVYAMGAKPLTALNVLCFPDGALDEEVMKLIMKGGSDKAREAGVPIIGGHSISDKELKYGLSITGTIHPEKIKLNHSLRSGDKLVLTKPIGVGILTTALKNGILNESDMPDVIESMLTLNRLPASLFDDYDVTACTDITGYGLLGHLWEMIAGSSLGVRLFINKIPFFSKALPFARESNHIPGGTIANYNFNIGHIAPGNTEQWYLNILFDPQTSGGLLIGIKPSQADRFISELNDYPWPLMVIGEVIEDENKIFLE